MDSGGLLRKMNMNLADDRSLVIFSGGQDSTTCLAWALNRFNLVETIGFDYRQRHVVELECASKVREEIARCFPNWRQKLGEHHRVDLGVMGEISCTALTRDVEIKMLENNLPSTFVPGRNILFFTIAACVAYRRGLKHLVGGMCETDYSGYPDCRDDTIKALQVALNLGMESRFVIDTPLMWIDKAQTWSLVNDLGGNDLISLIIEHTHTCYHGDRSHRHNWGYGCGTCPACRLRADGFARYLQSGKVAQ
jgi:7-cyano-7-deazaguanine synthase